MVDGLADRWSVGSWYVLLRKTLKNGCKDSDYFKLQEATSVFSEVISRHKEEYQNQLALKLGDPTTNVNTYSPLSKTFYNGKKVPIIPPLLIDNKVITDF